MKPFLPFPQPVIKAKFISRIQRFLIRVEMPDGSTKIAYCANPGSLQGCLKEGAPILLWESPDIERKRRYTWRAIKNSGTWIGTDTHMANLLVKQSILSNSIRCLEGFAIERVEPRMGSGVRLDFHIKNAQLDGFLEVKCASVAFDGVARFPDSQTVRCTKQLNILKQLAAQGYRAIFLFLIQRDDVTCFRVNRDCDASFNSAFDQASRAGVEFKAIKHKITPKGYWQPQEIPVV